MTLIREYHENRQLASERPWVKGKIHGIRKYWYDNGQLSCETPCVKGKLHGMYKCWHPNGQLDRQTLYLNGKFITRIPEGTAYPIDEETL